MIGRLQGTLVEKHPPRLLIDIQGVGYEVEAPMSTFYQLPATGETVTLVTHLAVREDAHTLYGFASEAERGLFRQLIKISGVGAKLALTLLSGISVSELNRVVQEQDVRALTRLPGVGKKTAERLLVELKGKLLGGEIEATLPGAHSLQTPSTSTKGEAQQALVALGYKPQEAERLLAPMDKELSTEEMIRQALQGVAKKK